MPHHCPECPYGKREEHRVESRRWIEPSPSVHGRHVGVEGLGAEHTGLDPRHDEKLVGDRSDEDRQLFTLCKQGRRVAHAAEKRGRGHFVPPVPSHPQRKLPGEQAYHQEGDRGQHVGLLRDGELVKGLRVEEREGDGGAPGSTENR